MKSVFISYVYEDRKWRDSIVQWVTSGLVGSGYVATAERGDYRPAGEAAIKDHLRPLIRGAAAVVCVVGDNSHNHEWINYELSVAASLGKHIILARIPGTSGGKPNGWQHLPIVLLDPATLGSNLSAI